MRFQVDVNVLVYALRADTAEHDAARTWLLDAMREPGAVGVTGSTLAGVVRIASNPRVLADPDLTGAFDFAEALIERGARFIEPGPRHWAIFRRLCLQHHLAGDDVPDAHLAAIAIEQDATLVTHDRGFGRFAELRTFDPIAA